MMNFATEMKITIQKLVTNDSQSEMLYCPNKSSLKLHKMERILDNTVTTTTYSVHLL